MSWYYARGTQQAGPVEEAELQRLLQTGELTPESLVWTTGMAEWKPYREVFAAAGAERPVGTAGGTAPGLAGVQCAECGRTFRADEVVTLSGRSVCATCKPIYLQRLREGVDAPGELVFATFGQRFAAKFVDGLILWVVNTLIQVLMGMMAFATPPSSGEPAVVFIVFQILIVVVSLVINIGYAIFFHGRFGATPGKMALKIRVVTPEGDRITYGRATGRAFAEMLSGLICYIGYLMAAWDDEKRALHDRMCHTRVVKR